MEPNPEKYEYRQDLLESIIKKAKDQEITKQTIMVFDYIDDLKARLERAGQTITSAISEIDAGSPMRARTILREVLNDIEEANDGT